MSLLPTTYFLGFAVVWWPYCAGGVALVCHCAPKGRCPDNGHCPNGCENGWSGPGCQIGNIALRKPARQSTTYTGDGIDTGPHMAVDGLYPNNNSAAHCSHTDVDNNADPWWYVELDGKDNFIIQSVTIVDRRASDRLANFSIVYTTSLTNNPPDFTNWQTCIHYDGRPQNRSQSYLCSGKTVAKRVGVRLRNMQSDNLLVLCEVIVVGYKIYECPTGYTGPGCLLRDCASTTCTDDCNSINGCYYFTCPNSAVLLNDCWIKIPSITNLAMSTAVTCDSITVIVDTFVDGVDRGTYSAWLELKFENNVTTYPSYAASNGSVKFNLTMTVPIGSASSYRMVLQWCSSNQGSCFFSNSSWRSVSTARRSCGVTFLCHCAPRGQCPSYGHCPNGCEDGWSGPGCQIGNLALRKSARQSTTYTGDGNDYGLHMAVDGLYPSDDSADHCSHTDGDNNADPWWYVELDGKDNFIIQSVTIVDRQESDRLANFSIMYTTSLTNNPPDFTNWQTCVHIGGRPQNLSQSYSCSGTAVAKRVGVRLRNMQADNLLTLCEVLVVGYKKYECNGGFAGPGCLLHDCNATNCTGGCDEFGGCKYSTCPDSAFLPPNCWIRLPSLANAAFLPRATCNSIYININRLSNDGDLNISSVIVEMTSHSASKGAKKTKTVTEVLMGTIFYAQSGTHYSVRLLPQWCNDSSGACFDGPGSSWINVTTKERLNSYSTNDTCFMLNVNNTMSDCEEIVWQVQCVERDAEKTVMINNATFVCGLTAGIKYKCTVNGFMDNIIVEQRIYNIPGPTEEQVYSSISFTATVIVGVLSGLLLCGVLVAIVIFVLRRRQREARTKSLANAMYINTNEGSKLHEPYATITMTTSSSGAEDYAALGFPSDLTGHHKAYTKDVYDYAI